MSLFEDYDKVHIGSVTRSQFHRVLNELELEGESIQYKCSLNGSKSTGPHRATGAKWLDVVPLSL